MKKFSTLFLVLFSFSAFSQQYWEDGFWKKQVQNRYAKTGSMQGVYTDFYRNGQIKWQGTCNNAGIPDSIWVYYSGSGKKYWEGHYNGRSVIYDPAEDFEDTLAVGTYQNGVKEGIWLFKKYGERKSIGYYHNGQPVGNWKNYEAIRKVVGEYVKTAYDYNTQTETTFDTDGKVTATEQIDSLTYRNDFADNIYSGSSDESGTFEFTATAQYLNLNPLNNYFLQPGHTGLQSPLLMGGLAFQVQEDRFYMSFNINYMPVIAAQPNDSIKLNLSAYSFSANYGGDLIGLKWLDIAPTFGLGFQQLRLKVSYTKTADQPDYSFNERTYKLYKNPSPYVQAMLHIRFNLGDISICGSGGYVQDCSGNKWRYNGSYLANSPKTSVSGFIAMASIGIHFD